MDVLSREKLQTAINKHPTVLHLICHGAYCQKEKDFYRAIEDEEAKVHKLFPKNLKKLLENRSIKNIKMVFINACHSENIAKVF